MIYKMNKIFNFKQKILLLFLLFILIVDAFFELCGIALFSPLITILLNTSVIETNSVLHKMYIITNCQSEKEFILLFASLLLFVFCFKNIFVGWSIFIQNKIIYGMQYDMAVRLFNGFLNKPYLYFTQNNSNNILECVIENTHRMFFGVLSLTSCISEILVVSFVVFYLMTVNIFITSSLFLLLLCSLFLYYYLFRNKELNAGINLKNYHGLSLKNISESIKAIKDIKLLEKESFFTKHFSENYRGFINANQTHNVLRVMPRLIIETICICGMILSVIFQLLNNSNFLEFIPQLSVFAFATLRLLPSVNRISGYINSIIFYLPAFNNVYEEIIEVECHKKSNSYDIQKVICPYNNYIDLYNLSFQYALNEPYILKDISLSIQKNTSIAIIGPSGAGKSTIADLLLGIIYPTKGNIYCEGKEIYDAKSNWHKRISNVPQSIFLLDDSIKHNIAFAVDDENIDHQMLRKAIVDAQLQEFIDSLEHGIDTQIGENGIRLSGGQRQRIGIARALYNAPEILVLDEATSSLDNDTEKAIMHSINHLKGKVTLVIIAHRLETIKKCDYVYKIKDGNIFLN